MRLRLPTLLLLLSAIAHPGHSSDLLITMCNFKYFPGAVSLLESARTHGAWHQELAVLVTDDVPSCARHVFEGMNVHVINISDQWVGKRYPTHAGPADWITTVHFGKLDILTQPYFRRFARIVYADSDMKVRQPLLQLLEAVDNAPAAYVRVGNAEATLYREAHTPVAKDIQTRFPDRQKVHSTRLMVFNTRLLSSPAEMAVTLTKLLTTVGSTFNKMYEQGVLQLLFYTSLADLPAADVALLLEHYYSSALPWDPKHRSFGKFALWFEAQTHASTCFRQAVFQR